MPGDSRPDSDHTRYRLLIDSIPYGFWAVDVEGRITEANPALSELLGYPEDELVGTSFQRFIAEDERARAETLFRETMAGEVTTVELDIWVQRRDGERRLMTVASRAIRRDGQVVGTHGIARDVTEERAAEDRVRRTNQRLELLLDRMPAFLWTVDRDIRVTSSSGRGLQTMGLSPEEMVGASLYDLLDTRDDDHPQIRAHREALEGTARTLQLDWRDRAFEVRVEPIVEEGLVVGAIGAALDVTERMETKRQLVQQRAHWERLFESAPEAIVLLDSDDRITASNPEFEQLFGYSVDEARGRRITDLIVPPDRRGEATELNRRIARGERVSAEAIRQHKNGTALNVSILGTPVDVGGERWVYGIYRDVTEQKRLQEQLLHSQRLDAVGQLAGGIAHDFNNILTVILGHARVLAGEVDGWIREDLGEIEKAAERAATLTRQLLTFSRRQVVERRSVDVSRVIRDMEDMLTRLIGDHIRLETRLDPSLPAVSMDPGQLEQVVMNLVLNARDAMPTGGSVTVTTTRVDEDPESAVDGPYVVLEVADTGTGMSEEERTRMFEPFFTTKGPGKGTGLGLSTVYGIVEQSGGQIDVESEKGRGSMLRVRLPSNGDAPAQGTRTERRAARDSGAGGHERVLLVDDDSPVRNVSRQILERQGYHVTVAASGDEALERVRDMSPPPDLLLTDLVMPGMSGQDLADRVREIAPGIIVLYMSGYTESDLTGGPVSGSNFIPKPFDPSTLSRRVREALSA